MPHIAIKIGSIVLMHKYVKSTLINYATKSVLVSKLLYSFSISIDERINNEMNQLHAYR